MSHDVRDMDREYLAYLRTKIHVIESRIKGIQDEIVGLEAKIEDCQAQRSKAVSDLEAVRHIERIVAMMAGEAGVENSKAGIPPGGDGGIVRSSPSGAQRLHADVVAEVLGEAGRPMRVQEIIEAVKKKGQRLPEDPKLQYSAIYAAIQRRRDTTFEKNERGEWQLKESIAPNDPEVGDVGEARDGQGSSGYAQCAETVIRMLGRAATVPEIVDWMIEKQIKPPEKRKLVCNTMHNVLNHRADRFRKIDRAFDLITE